MPNPFNPLDWITSAQDWFRKTERSSGFRPYLIFLLMHTSFALLLLFRFSAIDAIRDFALYSLSATYGAFIIIFAIKAHCDPPFCRSEKHVEAVKRLELMEQSGDSGPQPINVKTIDVIANPSAPQLGTGSKGGDT